METRAQRIKTKTKVKGDKSLKATSQKKSSKEGLKKTKKPRGRTSGNASPIQNLGSPNSDFGDMSVLLAPSHQAMRSTSSLHGRSQSPAKTKKALQSQSPESASILRNPVDEEIRLTPRQVARPMPKGAFRPSSTVGRDQVSGSSPREPQRKESQKKLTAKPVKKEKDGVTAVMQAFLNWDQQKSSPSRAEKKDVDLLEHTGFIDYDLAREDPDAGDSAVLQEEIPTFQERPGRTQSRRDDHKPSPYKPTPPSSAASSRLPTPLLIPGPAKTEPQVSSQLTPQLPTPALGYAKKSPARRYPRRLSDEPPVSLPAAGGLRPHTAEAPGSPSMADDTFPEFFVPKKSMEYDWPN